MNAPKTLLFAATLGFLIGCASNPVLTGKPQHWKGKRVEELRAALGIATQIIPQSDGSEIWVYSKRGEFLAPAQERTKFGIMGAGGSSAFGASGGINTVASGERVTDYENVWRFQIKNGKVRKWYAQRLEGGQVVWEDH
jgi:hypothetical protein